MQGERLLLLLGTDDSSDWTKTELIGFDLPTAELKSLSTEPLVQFAVADQTKLFICQRDDENSQYTFHYMNTETGEIYPLFFHTEHGAFIRQHELLAWSGIAMQ